MVYKCVEKYTVFRIIVYSSTTFYAFLHEYSSIPINGRQKGAAVWIAKQSLCGNLILTDVCAIALYWLIPSAKMLVLPLGVLCAVGYMLWLGRCFLNDCKANLPNEDYQRIAAEFGFIWFWNPGRREQWQYTAEESGETGAALLRIWRGNMVLVIVSLAVMAVLVWMG